MGIDTVHVLPHLVHPSRDSLDPRSTARTLTLTSTTIQRRPQFNTLARWIANPDWLKPPTPIAQHFLYRDNLTLLAGREKDGKSTLMSYIASCVSSGRDFLGEPVERGMVLWLRLEEPPSTLFQRLIAFGADPENIVIPEALINGPDDIPWLMDQVKPLVVCIDTLTALAFNHVTDPYDSVQWTRIVHPLGQLAQKHRAGILLGHHARKSDGKYRDSTAIGANTDHIFEMGSDPDKRVRVMNHRGRWEIPPFKLRYADDEYRLADARRELDARVLAFVAANPECTQDAVVRGVGGKAEAVRDVLAGLAATGAILDSGTGNRHKFSRGAHPSHSSRLGTDGLQDESAELEYNLED